MKIAVCLTSVGKVVGVAVEGTGDGCAVDGTKVGSAVGKDK